MPRNASRTRGRQAKPKAKQQPALRPAKKPAAKNQQPQDARGQSRQSIWRPTIRTSPVRWKTSRRSSCLIATILSAQCTDERVNMVTPELFRRWPTPAEMAAAPIEALEKVIQSTGFFRNKAKNIKACSQASWPTSTTAKCRATSSRWSRCRASAARRRTSCSAPLRHGDRRRRRHARHAAQQPARPHQAHRRRRRSSGT